MGGKRLGRLTPEQRREHKKALQRRYYARHKDKILADDRARYAENRDTIRARQKVYNRRRAAAGFKAKQPPWIIRKVADYFNICSAEARIVLDMALPGGYRKADIAQHRRECGIVPNVAEPRAVNAIEECESTS